ncbi:hypothetical protein [Dendrosporobacter sp. 1207_IL3150]|uniref:hypothetical protein n=1 Tax=Dendrosporobacter sp. 1207_IL3150 TaxID=3084054 RepID=UPI002FDAF6C4
MNMEILFRREFGNLISKYNMKYLLISDNEFALVGRKFALVFLIHLGDIFIRYINANDHGELDVYNFDSFLFSKFNDVDRENIKKSNTVEEKISNELQIIARGLLNHWHNLLEGDKNWLGEYLKYPLAGKPKKANPQIIDIFGDLKN